MGCFDAAFDFWLFCFRVAPGNISKMAPIERDPLKVSVSFASLFEECNC